MSLESLIFIFIATVLALEGPCAFVSGENECLYNSPVVSVPRFIKKEGSDSSTFSLVQFNCSAAYPIEWTFQTFPREVEWNVTYVRVAEDVLDESSMYFNAVLSFNNIAASSIPPYGALCRNTLSLCGTGISKELMVTLDKETASQDGDENMNETLQKCSLQFWFDEVSKQYFCSTTDDTVLPRVSFSYCSDPTDCGLTSQKPKCISKAPKTYTKFNCFGKNCTSLRLEREVHVPKIITCWDQNVGEDRSSVDIMALYRTNKGLKGHSNNSYMSWEAMNDPNNENMLSVQVSNDKILSHESFDLSCASSYYFFAEGMHLTLKHLSNPHFMEEDVKDMTNLTIRGSIEFDGHGAEIPIQRSLLAQGISVIAGDYQATCYAPLWNSTKWITKSILISISDAILPVFLTGNHSRDIEFKPNKNITCLAKGSPPPRLSWVYDTARIPTRNVFETEGSQKSLTWSVITLPDNFDGFRMEFKCRAENIAGFDEKLFVLNKSDESVLVTTKIAAGIIVFGFISNLVVGYFCWKYLFSEEADTAVVKFVRSLRDKTGMGNNHSNPGQHNEEERMNKLQSDIVVPRSRGGLTRASLID